jgi:hypothetical protein
VVRQASNDCAANKLVVGCLIATILLMILSENSNPMTGSHRWLTSWDLEFAGMSTRERVRVTLEWFGRRQTIALPINSVVGCLIATILLMILSENKG